MPDTLSYRALVVGINDYRHGISPLHSAVADAEAIAAVLTDPHGYAVRCLTDADASAAAILEALAEAANSLDEEHGFLLYFAGHGVALGDGSDGPQGYLLGHDARPTDEASWLSMTALRAALDALPCRHLLVVLDCCFAGAFRWSSSRDALLVSHPLYDSQYARYLDGEAWQALTSAAHDQRAADSLPGRRNTRDGAAAGGHSPFADALLRALAGDADSARAGYPPDGVITATELYQFLFEALVPPGASARQTPGLWPLRADNRGEFMFRNPQAALSTLPDPPLDEANNPWLGLRAYGAADASLFFGRRRVVEALRARIADPAAPALLVVVGASGTGKSSVVKAGLLPALLREETQPPWQIVEAPRLRADPSAQLAQALQTLAARGPGRGLLLFDQFEELFTQCRDETLRQRFLASLVTLLQGADAPRLVLTLRLDFEPRLAAYAPFAALLEDARLLVPGFSSEELREVVEAPLRAKALYFDPPELVDRLLDEVAAMPGALPLLSFALAEMYRQAQLRRRRSGALDRALTREDFEATGGVVGALHRRASALYAQCDAAQQRSVERVFLRMVSQEGARLARRRVSHTELSFADAAEQARIEQVLDQYVAARLLVVDGDYVEPAHDTLVVAWEQLQRWLTDSSTHWLLRALWRAARDWQNGAHPAGLLWNDDPRLPQAVALTPELNRLEQAFVAASERRRKLRRRLLAGVSLVTMALLAGAALFSMERAREAQAQTRIAEQQLAQARHASGRALLAQARQSLERDEPFAAALQAAEAIGFRHFGIAPGQAIETADDFDGGSADSATLPPQLIQSDRPEYLQTIRELSRANLSSLQPLAWRELGRAHGAQARPLLVGLGADDAVELRDFEHERLHRLPPPGGRVLGFEFSADAGQLAARLAADNGRAGVALWRAGTDWGQSTLQRLELPREVERVHEIETLSFAPDGSALAAALPRGIVYWTLGPKTIGPGRWLAIGSTQGVNRQTSLRFAPDGQSLLSGGWHNRLTRYPRPLGAEAEPAPLRLQGSALGPEWTLWSENLQKGDFVRAIEFSPDGRLLLMASAHQILTARVEGARIDFSAGSVHLADAEVHRLAVSAHGRWLAYHDVDRVRILGLPSLRPLQQLVPPTFRPQSVDSLQWFERDRLLIIGSPGELLLVDASGLDRRHFELALDTLPAELAPASGQARLRELLDSGRLDPVRLAYPDPASAPEGLRWQAHEKEDGLVLSFSVDDVDADGKPVQADRGALQLSLQPGEEELVSVGVDRFQIPKLRGSDRALIELVRIADHALVFSYPLDEGLWGLDRLRFSDDGRHLWAKASNFDGYIDAEFALPVQRPDLRVYVEPALCQAPINVPEGHWLARTRLLDCAD
jgi:WD40 repeat protein